MLAFPAVLGRDATTALRGAGFRFNKLLQHREGLARFDEADSLATAHGGTVRRVATAEALPRVDPGRLRSLPRIAPPSDSGAGDEFRPATA